MYFFQYRTIEDAILNMRCVCFRLGEVWILNLIYLSTSNITSNPGECQAGFCSLSNSLKSICTATYSFGLLSDIQWIDCQMYMWKSDITWPSQWMCRVLKKFRLYSIVSKTSLLYVLDVLQFTINESCLCVCVWKHYKHVRKTNRFLWEKTIYLWT